MQIDSAGRFVLHQFDQSYPFSSFLPGIAGERGTPMWVFYVNRGQAITSFGIKSKDEAMLEFQPANKSYWMTDVFGFRTFVKIIENLNSDMYQPFFSTAEAGVKRSMVIEMNHLTIEEVHPTLGLKTTVQYFTLPDERYAALVRQVCFENISRAGVEFECLDGLPAFVPFGVSDFMLKKMGRTMEAWMQVENLDKLTPFFHMRASAADTADVTAVHAGHFAFAMDQKGNKLSVFVDPVVIFGQNTSFQFPERFLDSSLSVLRQQHQNCGGQTPCALFGQKMSLQPGESGSFYEVFGHLQSNDELVDVFKTLSNPAVIEGKRDLARKLVMQLTQPIQTHSSHAVFDQYCRQTYLDNLIRGGYPTNVGNRIVHIYGRKHGDPERDYNEFSLAPEPYSQGNANFRDVNQNRRSDNFFAPQVGRLNIYTFMDLLQLDGYNPLVVQGSRFTLSEENFQSIIQKIQIGGETQNLLRQSFTPGRLYQSLLRDNLPEQDMEKYVHLILSRSEQHLIASHGEGYWSDHWTYNLDLVESYLGIYPEQLEDVCFLERRYRFYENDHQVNPRDKRYVLLNGEPIQLHAVWKNEKKTKVLENRGELDHWVHVDYGNGLVYQTDLFSKLLILAVIKLATLDPYGMGIEMEGGKPGWYDALNGLPGLFGSSMAETYELRRLLDFLSELTVRFPDHVAHLPIEVHEFLFAIMQSLNTAQTDFEFWQMSNDVKEKFRDKIYRGISGVEKTIPLKDIQSTLISFQTKVDHGIRKAIQIQEGNIPTYFYYQAEVYDLHKNNCDDLGNPHITITQFRLQKMPLFLEGYVRYLKLEKDRDQARKIHQQVMNSPLFDPTLNLLKVNAPLSELSHQIGRARAFTPGWLENESIWLHMAYKYYLSLLESGLSDIFLAEIKHGLVPFWDAEQYGRSPLENSSFIVSSAHPEVRLHGRGFVARLSGSTAEFLSIWQHMMVGKNPFQVTEDGLRFLIQPTLPLWLFINGKIEFRFMDQCMLTIHNESNTNIIPQGKNQPIRWVLVDEEGKSEQVFGKVLTEQYARKLRDGKIKQMSIFFEERE